MVVITDMCAVVEELFSNNYQLTLNWLCVYLVSVPPTKQRLIAKYAYVANVNSPLGPNAEINLCQLEKMTMIAPHAQQEFWWFVEMDDGRRGYVPANYVMVCHLVSVP